VCGEQQVPAHLWQGKKEGERGDGALTSVRTIIEIDAGEEEAVFGRR